MELADPYDSGHSRCLAVVFPVGESKTLEGRGNVHLQDLHLLSENETG